MKVLQFLRHKALLISTIIAVVLGIVAGIMCRSLKPTPDAIQLVQFPGELFLRMLKMLMLPLIVASIITGVITYCIVFGVTLNQLDVVEECAATLPVTMQCVEQRMKMDTRISRFILPVGATVNMDGTAVYAAIAPMFIAQYNGISLTFGDVIIISLTAVLSSVGSAGVPGSGFAMLLLVQKAIGLPERGISFLVTVDWLIDTSETQGELSAGGAGDAGE
ncbi:excitatory amino acid transporter-like [Haliotis rubra]|uniref:excitatory amino acid transporter-like n=1 Tax=Haliotis rubra TaxID=36100 RepID=UPI001EE5E2D7|nr:excitatory amino acid transporter-like [Haliotis rubra]